MNLGPALVHCTVCEARLYIDCIVDYDTKLVYCFPCAKKRQSTLPHFSWGLFYGNNFFKGNNPFEIVPRQYCEGLFHIPDGTLKTCRRCAKSCYMDGDECDSCGSVMMALELSSYRALGTPVQLGCLLDLCSKYESLDKYENLAQMFDGKEAGVPKSNKLPPCVTCDEPLIVPPCIIDARLASEGQCVKCCVKDFAERFTLFPFNLCHYPGCTTIYTHNGHPNPLTCDAHRGKIDSCFETEYCPRCPQVYTLYELYAYRLLGSPEEIHERLSNLQACQALGDYEKLAGLVKRREALKHGDELGAN